MKPKVLVTGKIYDEILEVLQRNFELVLFEKLDKYSYPALTIHLSDAKGIFSMGLKVDEKLLDQAPQLKIVSNVSVGYDNFDIAEMTRRGIMATNTPEVLNDTTADAAMALLLATARRIPELDQYVKSGQWHGLVEDKWFGVDVYGKTLGIIGMGRIGTAIAKRAHLGFDMNILYHNRNRNIESEEKFGCHYCSLDDLLAKSDFVCLMTPLTSETEYLLGMREFKLMKNTAIFINVSRGKTVSEKDLITALQNKWIAAAGLDVFEQEPVEPNNPLLTFSNVVTLPHVGGATKKTRLNMMKLAAANLIQGLAGQRPQNLINEEAIRKRCNR
ncbi:2-hydroxyacid dehydrogenase [Neobacillus sp. SAB-20_R2A]|uniref:2-hydroxyacid dehydrogenase n=1 Tax=Neobacillus sp. SAB-20_R2A TaxID=3120519 RepID=UPI003C6DC638